MIPPKNENAVLVDIAIQRFTYAGTKRKALTDVHLNVHRGETIVLLGDSGSGKSTLLRCISGLCPYLIFGTLVGKITFHFVDNPFKLTRETYQNIFEHIGILFQNPEVQIISHIVLDELVFTLENRGIAREEIQKRLDGVTGLFPVGDMLEKPVSELSQGQKQIVALLSLFMQEPDLYVMDEPTAMLDSDVTKTFITYVKELKKEKRPTILLTTHKRHIAEELGNRIIVIKDGELVHESTNDWSAGSYVHQPFYPADNKKKLSETSGVSYRYDKKNWVLEDINLEFFTGEFVWIAGPNGSGKSTLGTVLAGLRVPQKGTVLFDGSDIRKHQDLYPGKIGILFQNPDHQIFATTIMEELSIGLRFIPGLSEKDCKNRIDYALEKLHFLKSIDTADPRELSFGQKKILNMLSLMIARPKVLILDEPDLALDQAHEEVMIELLYEMLQSGTLIIVISHNTSLIQKYAGRKVCLNKTVIYDGDPKSAVF